MKILHIISSGGMYGAEAVILNLSRTLNEGSHSSAVGVFANSSNLNLEFYDRAVSEGLDTHLIPCSGQMDRAAVVAIRDLAIRTKADIVHAHGFKADIYAYFALWGTGIPLVSTCHTWYDHDPTVSFYGKLDRFILRRYSAVVAVSDDVKDRLLGAGVREEKIRIVRNGIDLRPFSGATASLRGLIAVGESPTVGLVARLSPEKGVDIFLRAASLVLREIPAARFIVVGEGPEHAKLDALIEELGIRESVSLLGRRDDMPSVYVSFDLMVSSSRHEGLPMAILEGMASGLPYIATAVGDVPKIIQNGISGVLVRAEEVDVLASQMIALLQDPEARRRLGNAARRRVMDEFSAERMTSDYLNLYEQVIAKRAPEDRRGKSSVASGERAS